MKILIDQKGNKHFWTSGDFHSLFGVVKEADIKGNKTGKLKSHTGKEFIIIDASFPDKIKNLSKGAASTHPKDIGHIIATTGINNKSNIVDAGSGSGVLAAYLANISPNVTTYEKNKDFYNVAKKNLEKLKLKIKIKNQDISEGIKEKNLDLITLDLKDPEKVLSHAEKSLKSGGYLVAYLPHATQVADFIKSSKHHNFIQEKTAEIIEREWVIDHPKARPRNQILGHTAFLVFLRKY